MISAVYYTHASCKARKVPYLKLFSPVSQPLFTFIYNTFIEQYKNHVYNILTIMIL